MTDDSRAYYYYRIKHPDDVATVGGSSPMAIQEFLHKKAEWPSGSYEILESGTVNPFSVDPSTRWGVAVKASDGTVKLVRDQPA
jgi:hypothetical protein